MVGYLMPTFSGRTSEADLTGAGLSSADLRYSTLKGARLERANLEYADLRGANVKGANISDASLMWANLGTYFVLGEALRGVDCLLSLPTDTSFHFKQTQLGFGTPMCIQTVGVL